MNARSLGKGTKEEPNVVDSFGNYRMVGCICEPEEDHHIKWMWLMEGKPKRCACGNWFSLKVHEAPDRYKLPV